MASPIDKVKVWPLEAAVWENKSEDGEVYYSVSLSRTYKKDGEYKQSNNLRKVDLPAAALILQKAWDVVNELEEAAHSRGGAY